MWIIWPTENYSGAASNVTLISRELTLHFYCYKTRDMLFWENMSQYGRKL